MRYVKVYTQARYNADGTTNSVRVYLKDKSDQKTPVVPTYKADLFFLSDISVRCPRCSQVAEGRPRDYRQAGPLPLVRPRVRGAGKADSSSSTITEMPTLRAA